MSKNKAGVDRAMAERCAREDVPRARMLAVRSEVARGLLALEAEEYRQALQAECKEMHDAGLAECEIRLEEPAVESDEAERYVLIQDMQKLELIF